MDIRSRVGWWVLLVAALACVSCGSETEGASHDTNRADVGEPDVADDAGDEADAGEVDAAADTAGPNCDFVQVELGDGGDFVGQYVASYDHRFWWWDSADRTTVAFFRERDFGSYPDDESFRFVPLSSIAEMNDVPAEGRQCYREFARDETLTIGRLPLEGTSRILMGNSGYHKYEGGMGDFAWDFTRVDDDGTRFEADGSQNDDYFVWNEPVYAPASGYVVEVVRDAPDNTPGDYPEDAKNNMVGLHLGGAYYLYLLHFKQGSIPESIEAETTVEAGDLIGYVGNSGTSLEPHLHVSLLWHDANAEEPRSWSVPTEFEHIEVAPTPRGPFESHQYVVPETGESVRMVE